MKKFWEKVSIKKISSDSFCIMLDKRTLKTPLKRELVLPKLNLAQEVLKEWDQDSKNINAELMIFYGLMSTSLDKIIDNKNLYINDILDYIDTDLICYRAENPKELVELQKNKWDPIIFVILCNAEISNIFNCLIKLYKLSCTVGCCFLGKTPSNT